MFGELFIVVVIEDGSVEEVSLFDSLIIVVLMEEGSVEDIRGFVVVNKEAGFVEVILNMINNATTLVTLMFMYDRKLTICQKFAFDT